jgi:MFS family permease
MFLPSVLPNVFQAFKVEETVALKWAGQVVMFYTATAVVGTYLLCRLTGKIRTDRLIIAVGTLGVALQALLCLCPGIISFVAVRMVQTGMVAAVVPLVFSSFASDLDGRVIGFLNSSRFAGNALGPMMGTFVLAFSSLDWLYLSVSGVSLMVLLGFALYFGNPEESARDEGN